MKKNLILVTVFILIVLGMIMAQAGDRVPKEFRDVANSKQVK